MRALLCIATAFSGLARSGHSQTSADEYQVKGAFLYHFAQLVQWPAGVLNSADPSLLFCMYADEPRREELENIIAGKTIGSRVIHVRLINQPPEIQGCSILFLSRNQARRQGATLRSLRNTAVLTVGETSNFLSDGGMIRFHFDDQKIRFDINLEAAHSAHLEISSRLLLLATAVTGGAAERGR